MGKRNKINTFSAYDTVEVFNRYEKTSERGFLWHVIVSKSDKILKTAIVLNYDNKEKEYYMHRISAPAGAPDNYLAIQGTRMVLIEKYVINKYTGEK